MRNPSLSHLQCISCRKEYPVQDMPAGCPSCATNGSPSSVQAVYRRLPDQLVPAAHGYKWGEWLPYLDGVSLGEGDTPCVALGQLARELGIAQLHAKLEGANPTGSHKDRMSAQAVTRALEAGASRVVLASSGNAVISAAAYCAAAGLRCEVATYRDMPEPFVRALRRLGARREVFDNGEERWTHVRRRVEEEGAFALTNYSVPPVGSPVFGVEGYRAIALEIAAQGCLPEHVLVPTARGDLLWGIHGGLRDLHARGLVPRLPRLWAVEPFPRLARVLAGACAQGLFEGRTAQFSTAGNTVTLQQVLAVRASGGGAVVVGDAQADRGHRARAARALGRIVRGCHDRGAVAAARPRPHPALGARAAVAHRARRPRPFRPCPPSLNPQE